MKRKKLINKQLQLGTAFSVMRFYFVVLFVVIVLLVVHTAFTEKKITGTIKDLRGALETEQNIVNAFIKYADMTSSSDLMLKSSRISEDHRKSVKVIEQHITLLTGILKIGLIVIFIIAGIMIFMGVLLFYYMIRITHTISGPIYVMTQQIQDIMEGKEPVMRELRENDNLKDFYERFSGMVKKMQK